MAKKTKQTQFKFRIPKAKAYHGGALLLNRRKSKRPLAFKQALHVVIRSRHAVGVNSFRQTKNLQKIENLITTLAAKYHVQIYKQTVQGNHIHLMLRFVNRNLYRAYICVLTGKIASHVMNHQSFKNFQNRFQGNIGRPFKGEGSQKNQQQASPLSANGQKFFDFRPFTRILNWGKDF